MEGMCGLLPPPLLIPPLRSLLQKSHPPPKAPTSALRQTVGATLLSHSISRAPARPSTSAIVLIWPATGPRNLPLAFF